ncbi:MAG: FixH family protein, partial [Armatimonadetes bacterium]|nr:FixH family protein [Armatimonadota bacterium]
MSLKLRYHRLFGSVFLLVCAAFLPSGASAAPQTQAGPYRVEISVDPSPIVVGSATVLVRLTDASAKPVDGATVSALVKMPTMEMGETVRQAKPVAGKPGVYEAPAAFAMAGDYEAIITINGPNGEATSRIPLRTGQDTGGLSGTIGAKTGPSPVRFLPWLLLLAGVAFVIYRMRRTGQRLRWESVLHWQFLVTVVVLIALFLLASYAVQRYRRPG